MKLWRFHEPKSVFSSEFLEQFPDGLSYAAGEEITPAANYERGEKPTLHFPHLFRFAKLAEIQPSTALIETVKRTRYTVLVGPSGSGRNTLNEYLAETYADLYDLSLSMTTRDFRLDNGIMETEGKAYFHRDPAHVLNEVMSGNFLEWEIIHGQQVSGLHIDSFRAIGADKIGINDTELEGAEKLFKLDGRKSVFVVPDNYDIWLSRRIKNCSDEERKARLESSLREMQVALEKEYFEYFINELSEFPIGSPEYKESLSDNARRLNVLIKSMNGIDGTIEEDKEQIAQTAKAKTLLLLHIARIRLDLDLPVE
jgi:guanylate kinase